MMMAAVGVVQFFVFGCNDDDEGEGGDVFQSSTRSFGCQRQCVMGTLVKMNIVVHFNGMLNKCEN